MQKTRTVHTSVTCMDAGAVVSLAALNDGSTVALCYTDREDFAQNLMVSPEDINLLIVALQEFQDEQKDHPGEGGPQDGASSCGDG